MPLRPLYYDTETTGIKIGKDRIVEIAAYDPEQDRKFCTFVDPECPIPPEATAITHITDEMVQGAPKIAEALKMFVDFCGTDVVLIAHNNDSFDQPFMAAEFQRAGMAMPQWTYLDSLKWSRKYRRDLPKHGLQFLREAYGIEQNSAHRAMDDVIVLYQVFSKMVDDLSMKKILELLSETPGIVRMPFGKYAGKPLADVPKDYVSWLKEKGALDKAENANLKQTFVTLGLL